MKNWLQLLKRPIRSGKYLPELDGLRFIAILLVVLFHAYAYFYPKPYPTDIHEISGWQWPSYFFAQGYFGVQIFFIISGFIITLPFARHYLLEAKKPNFKNYLKRRFIRIEIPYFIALLLGFAILPHISEFTYTQLLPRLAASSIYAHNIIYNGELNPILPPSWTLEIEIQFYLLAPLLAKIFTITPTALRRTILLTTPLLINLLTPLYANTPLHFLTHTIAPYLPYFILGMLLTELHLTKESKTQPIYDYLAIPLWITLPILLHIPILDHTIPYLLAATMYMSMNSKYLKRALSTPIIAALGGMCYAIYLFHGAILQLIKTNLTDALLPTTIAHTPQNLIPILITTTLVFLTAPILYLLIEKPFIPRRKAEPQPSNCPRQQ